MARTMTRYRKRGGALRLAGGRRRRVHGAGLGDWLKKANKFFKKTRALSRGAKFIGSLGFQPEIMKKISRHAAMEGYGKRRVVRRRRGAGLGGRGMSKKSRAIGY